MAGKTRNRIWLLLCMALLFCAPAHAAQEATFRLEMDSLNLQKGVSAGLVVSLINAQGAEIVGIDGLEGFDVFSQSQSSYTSIVNNVSSYQEDIYFIVMPKEAGQYTLRANIQYNGQYYETNALEVTVSEEADAKSAAARGLFVETELSHTEAYLGEKVIVTYVLYARESIDSLGFTEYITIDGAMAKEMDADQINTETVYIDGNKYTRYEIKRVLIDPLKAGVCTIPSFNLQVNVIDDGLGGAFGGMGLIRSTTPRYVQTEARELLVKPLPTEGRPDDFSGIVGELSLSGQYSRDELNYGDSLALRVEASGRCNLDGLSGITGGEVAGFTVYETQKSAGETIEGGLYRAQKSFEAILIPQQTGELDVPPVSISYFNPASGAYERAEIPGATIRVLGEMPIAGTGGEGQGISVETVHISQVNYAEASDGYYMLTLSRKLVASAGIGLAALLLFGGGTAWLVLARKKRNTPLKSLYRQLMRLTDVDEIYGIFNAMMKHCYALNIKAASKRAVRERLADADLSARVTEMMDYMESAEARGEKGHIELKKKIKRIYDADLRATRGGK